MGFHTLLCMTISGGKSKKRYGGPPTALSHEEEKEIVQCCVVLQEMGFPVDRTSLTSVVSDYIKATGKASAFTYDSPGPDWFSQFMRRWKTVLSLRKPQHLTRKRAKALTSDRVGKWMEFVEQAYRKLDFFKLSRKELSSRLWNCDETAFATASSSKRVLGRRGTKSVYETMAGSGRELITVHWCGNANDDQIPPYILYKAQHLYSIWTLNGLSQALYGVSSSGWMEKPNFHSWFVKGFLPQLRKLKLIPQVHKVGQASKDPVSNESSQETDSCNPGVVLFFDGHYSSHINLEVIRAAKRNNVTLMTLPPNTTHALQPLDVGVFSPMKKGWQKILTQHRRSTHGRGVDKTLFPKLIKRLTDTTMKKSHFLNAFRGAGLYPQPIINVIPKSKLDPSDAVTRSSPAKGPHGGTPST